MGPCQGPDPLYVTPIQKNVEKSLTFLKNRKFSKTWQDPIYRQNLVYYLGPCQGPDPLYVTAIQKKYKKSHTFLKNRKFSKTWPYPIYRQNLVYYILYTIYLGPCQGPDPLYVTPIQKNVEKSLTFLKNRKFSKTWQDPIYRQNLVYYLGPCQGPDPLYVTAIQKKYKKSHTFLKNRKFSKTWQDPKYRKNSVYYHYIYISYKTARVVGLTSSLKSQGRGLRNPRKSTVCNYNTVCIINNIICS